MHAITMTSESPDQTELAAADFARSLLARRETDAFLALYGDLGAGKTAFVRGLASVLAPDARVTSPTYTIVNQYPGKDGFTLCHFDMYRIESEDDLYSIGFEDYDHCVRAVEWCENIPFALPPHYYKITITKDSTLALPDPVTGEITDCGKRHITIEEIV